jgi:hypothetical protein
LTPLYFCRYIFGMISQARLIEVAAPIAPLVLSADARAIARLAQRKEGYAGLDWQPVAAALASERRAIVATDMRASMAAFAWDLNGEHLASGAYEWFKPDVAMRLSKTTPRSRAEDAAAALGLQGVQGGLFATTADADIERDTFLVRLMGNVFDRAWVDVVALSNDGRAAYQIPLQAIARMGTEQIGAAEPAEAEIELPRVALPKARGIDSD